MTTNPEVAATIATIRTNLEAVVRDATEWLARQAEGRALVGQQWCVTFPDGFGTAIRHEGTVARWVNVRGDLCGVTHTTRPEAVKLAAAVGGRPIHMADLVAGRMNEARGLLAELATL